MEAPPPVSARWIAALRLPTQPPLHPLSALRAVAGILLAIALPTAILALAGRWPLLGDRPFVAMSLATTMVSLMYMLLVRTTEWRRVAELGLRALPRELGIGLGLGLAVCLAMLASALGLNAIAPGVAASAQVEDGALVRAFVFSRRDGIIEEIVFRGLLLRWLMGVTTARRAVIGQALVFGGIHFPIGGIAHVLLATTMGLALGYAFVWRRSLWTPIAIHFSWDLYAYLPNGSEPATESAAIAQYVLALLVAAALAFVCRRAALGVESTYRVASPPQ